VVVDERSKRKNTKRFRKEALFSFIKQRGGDLKIVLIPLEVAIVL